MHKFNFKIMLNILSQYIECLKKFQDFYIFYEKQQQNEGIKEKNIL